MRLWNVTDSADVVRGYGFGGTIVDQVSVDTPPEVTMPAHLAEPTEGPDE